MFYIIKVTFFPDKTLIYQKSILQHILSFNKDLIINLIISIIIIFIKKKFIREKRKAKRHMKERESEILYSMKEIGFLEIKKEPHKNCNLNGNADDNKLEEIKDKNKKYNKINNYIANNNYIIIVIILIKSIILIKLFYKTKSNIFDNSFYLNFKNNIKSEWNWSKFNIW